MTLNRLPTNQKQQVSSRPEALPLGTLFVIQKMWYRTIRKIDWRLDRVYIVWLYDSSWCVHVFHRNFVNQKKINLLSFSILYIHDLHFECLPHVTNNIMMFDIHMSFHQRKKTFCVFFLDLKPWLIFNEFNQIFHSMCAPGNISQLFGDCIILFRGANVKKTVNTNIIL